MLRWALTTAKAHEAAKGAGRIIYEPPELLPGLNIWYEDFWELSTDRQIGMAEGPIPKSSIDRHVEGWAYDEADMFRACIRAMDDIYLRHRAGKLEPEAPEIERKPGEMPPNPARDQFLATFGAYKPKKSQARGPGAGAFARRR